ncbi:peptidoglycan editing factor PgeF [Marilutibacter aestuarii]|uniref:Purine nucleoside phosphorylase n=1 Tax=Marilutibacter aestuarii TaxID=1706195 RepID=A0A508AV24_9GAMM|nr:peptidoglycan editing factor PgeF [Lysobacter aestuarii]TQD49652.1 peptidoglycan editing factor PgeF [Lysobacter aestuarii]
MATPWFEVDWPAPPRVRAISTLRHGGGQSPPPFDDFNLGLRCGDAPESAQANREALIRRAGLPSAPRWLRQVHGTGVLRLGTAGDGGEPEADAAVTAEPGVVIAIQTADCLPVLFCADDGREVGGAHAGWRGLAAGVLEATVAALRTPPDRLCAWLGPAAGPVAYEVGEEVREAFVSSDRGAEAAFAATRPGHWNVDLYALARRRLAVAGVPSGRIHGGTRCTISEPTAFFSHRRDGRSGRMASLLWIE